MRANGFLFLALLASGCALSETVTPYYTGDGPSVTGLDVTSERGNVGGGTVTISGSGFGSDANQVLVLFADKNAAIQSVTDSAVTVTVPNGPVNGGKVAITVANADNYFVFGDDDSESGYVYDPGPTYDDDPTEPTIYDEQNAYVLLQNYSGIIWESWVGTWGTDGMAEFLEFAYPRYHSQDMSVAMAPDQGPDDEWVVQVPAQVNYIMGLEDLRLEVDDFVVYNAANERWGSEYLDPETLEPVSQGTEGALVYDYRYLNLCEEAYKDSRDKARYSAEWPVEDAFFWSDTDDGSVPVTIDFSDAEPGDGDQAVYFADGETKVQLTLPPQMEVAGTQGFSGGSGFGEWTLGSAGVGSFDDCFDDEDDGDRESTLSDVALRWEWEPLPETFDEYVQAAVADTSNVIQDVQSYVRVNVTEMSIGWIGGESYPVRTTLVVPDTNNYDEETGMSSVEMPLEVFYQFPTADVFAGSGPMGTTIYDDPTDPRWGYMFVSVDRITEYRLASADDLNQGVGLKGDLIVAYSTGDFGLFSHEHPLDDGDSCEDCVDNDGDGWVDDEDPDCEGDYRDDGSDEAEDGYTEGLFSCNDGVDNDEDGLIDWEDPDCDAGDEMESNCDDGRDNDDDGWEDELDGECMEEDGVELGEDKWECSNGVDDDDDGWIDVDDPDCEHGQDTEDGLNKKFECNDGIDNDLNGDADSLDPACFYGDGALGEFEAPEMFGECINGEDDDKDGFTDANDPDCEVGSNNNESREYWTDDYYDLIPVCYNGEDDDGDTFTDAYDPGCWGEGDEPNGFFNSEEDPVAAPDCDDGADNDGDGWFDVADPDCDKGDYELGYGSTECNDGKDNDGDKLFDAADKECADAYDDSEGPEVVKTECADGVDNDKDGWTDAADPDCDSGDVELGFGKTECNDGKDNDGDKLFDADELKDCTDAYDDNEAK